MPFGRKEAKALMRAATAAKGVRDQSPSQRWEYKVVWSRKGRVEGLFGAGRLELALDRWGSQGWELVQFSNERLVFKRQVVAMATDELQELAQIEVPEGDEE